MPSRRENALSRMVSRSQVVLRLLYTNPFICQQDGVALRTFLTGSAKEVA